jgi:ABC-type iron transport system FetAB ATPase subunit
MRASRGDAEPPLLRLAGVRHDGLEATGLELEARSMAFISGPSGSGKTRLLRVVADLDAHYGDIWLDGRHRSEFKGHQWRRQVGMLPTESHWWRNDAASHFATLPGTEALEGLRLKAIVLKRPIDQLSTGERQRLALLRLLANAPRVLLLDEPTASLDADSAGHVEAGVRAYVEETGAAVIWVSHDENQAKRLATRRYTMNAGRLTAAERGAK